LEYGDRQRSCPVFPIQGVGVGVTGYENLVALSRNGAQLSRQIANQRTRMGIGSNAVSAEVRELAAELHEEAPALFHSDPPIHTVHRRLVNQAFMPRRVRLLEPRMRQLAHELIDRFVGAGHAEFIQEFAVPFPLGMLTGMMGVAREDMMVFKRWTDDMLAGVSDILTDERRLEVTRSGIEFQRHFLAMIAERRDQPGDDVLSDLVTARLDDGRRLHDGELLSIIAQLATAGHETSTNFLGNAIVIALTHAGLWERLRGDRGAIPDFLEEVLRFDPPLQCTYRRATSDLEIDGIPINEGQTVAAFWGAAGYDPAVFEAPDRFLVGRDNARKHLAFGHGIHFCVGSELARLEGRIAFNALLDRLNDTELDRAASDLSHHPTFAHHGYRSIVLRFAAAESR
jgi:cytochrome P450